MRTAHHRRVLAGTSASAAAAMLVLTGTPADADAAALTQLAEGYLQQRADMLTTTRPTARAATARVRATRSMTAQVQDDLAALVEKGKRYKDVDGGYTKAQVDVEVTDTSVTGQSATLRLTERTRLYLPFTPQEVADGAPEYEELSVPHTVKFTQGSDGAWLLSSDKADTDGGPTPTTQVSDVDATDGTDDGGGKAEEDEVSKDAASGTAPLPGSSDDSGDKPEVRSS